MVLRLQTSVAVLEQFVDSRQQLRFVKRFDHTQIVADRSQPLGCIGIGVGSNEEARDQNAILEQSVPQGKTIHAGELHINHQAIRARQLRISQRALRRFVGFTNVVVRTQQSRNPAPNRRIVVNQRDSNGSFGIRHHLAQLLKPRIFKC